MTGVIDINVYVLRAFIQLDFRVDIHKPDQLSNPVNGSYEIDLEYAVLAKKMACFLPSEPEMDGLAFFAASFAAKKLPQICRKELG